MYKCGVALGYWAAAAEEVIRNSNKQPDFYLNNTFTTNWMSTNTHKRHFFPCSLLAEQITSGVWTNYSKQFQHWIQHVFEEKEVTQNCDLCRLWLICEHKSILNPHPCPSLQIPYRPQTNRSSGETTTDSDLVIIFDKTRVYVAKPIHGQRVHSPLS